MPMFSYGGQPLFGHIQICASFGKIKRAQCKFWPFGKAENMACLTPPKPTPPETDWSTKMEAVDHWPQQGQVVSGGGWQWVAWAWLLNSLHGQYHMAANAPTPKAWCHPSCPVHLLSMMALTVFPSLQWLGSSRPHPVPCSPAMCPR